MEKIKGRVDLVYNCRQRERETGVGCSFEFTHKKVKGGVDWCGRKEGTIQSEKNNEGQES